MKMTINECFALREASRNLGFMPYTKGAMKLAVSLEAKGLVYQSLRRPEVWFITEDGRAALTEETGGEK